MTTYAERTRLRGLECANPPGLLIALLHCGYLEPDVRLIPTPGSYLPDDSVLWDTSHSAAFSKGDWSEHDTRQAAVLLMEADAQSRLLLEILMANPGRVFTSRELLLAAPARFGRVSTINRLPRRFRTVCRRLGRELPVAVWRSSRTMTLCAMKPSCSVAMQRGLEHEKEIVWMPGDGARRFWRDPDHPSG